MSLLQRCMDSSSRATFSSPKIKKRRGGNKEISRDPNGEKESNKNPKREEKKRIVVERRNREEKLNPVS